MDFDNFINILSIKDTAGKIIFLDNVEDDFDLVKAFFKENIFTNGSQMLYISDDQVMHQVEKLLVQRVPTDDINDAYDVDEYNVFDYKDWI